jgi:hypothetical protein
MLLAVSAQPAPIIAAPGRTLDQPSAYSPIPQRLITDLHDNVLAIGLYGFIARLYLVAQAPVPLSVHDVLRYDPTLSRGAVLRALARLRAGGYLIEATQPGQKTRYTPAWGRVGGVPLPWNMHQPCLGRPRHVARLRLDRRLFDICMGKLTPHTTRAAVITRYVTAPALSLADIGCYALTLSGVPRATPALIRLGAVQDGAARPLPSDEHLLAQISQRALDLGEQTDRVIGLTISGTRKLGVTPLLAPDIAAATAQPLFFVPPGTIGSLIHPLIGSMIAADAAGSTAAFAAPSDERRSDGGTAAITWESRDPGDETIPPPTPPDQTPSGGGADAPVVPVQKAAARRPDVGPLPDTEAATALQALNVKPAQIVELAHMPLMTVDAAIADGRARPGVRDLAGWVVSLLRAHRDYGWKIAPPAPTPDSPEALRSAFAHYAAEQQAARSVEPNDVEPGEMEMTRVSACGGEDNPRLAGPVRPPLGQLWNDVQAAMRTQITRQEFNTWIRPAVLRSIERGIATISAPSARIKDGLEQRYTAPLRELLRSCLGEPMRVRITIHDHGSVALTQSDAARAIYPTDALASVAPDHRPDWISADDWTTLPAILRAALIGSTVERGAVQAISPYLTRLLEMRYTREVGALIAAVDLGHGQRSDGMAVPALHSCPMHDVQGECG